MKRLAVWALGVLMCAGAVPEGATRHSDPCSFWVQCTQYPDRLVLDDWNPSNYHVAGEDVSFNCREGDVGYCDELFPCNPEEDDEAPLDKSDLSTLISSGSHAEVVAYLKTNRRSVELVPERDLILVKAPRSCGGRVVEVHEVHGLAAILDHARM